MARASKKGAAVKDETFFQCLGGRVSYLRVGRVYMLEAFGASFALVGCLWQVKLGRKVWGNLKG
jgi:hypothetical protein